MLNVGPDAMAQPVTVPEERCLPRALLISADEMCEERGKISRFQRGVGNPTRKLPFIQPSVVMRKRSTTRKKVRLKSRISDIDSQKYQKSVLNGEQPFMEICIQEKGAKEKPPLIHWTAAGDVESALPFVFTSPRKCREVKGSELGVPTLRVKSVNNMAKSRCNKES
ncbi:splicing factor 3B subunit 2 [Trichonephila clavipes]|nr:splicing factor 3B subunit 2 [Trichonephila clavipes]